MGYAVAVTRKEPDLAVDMMLNLPRYLGLWATTNLLTREVLERDPECVVVVTGGDDVFPDGSKPADEIAAEFVDHFRGTLGVMQPTGGRPWSKGLDQRGRSVVERCAWSPWMGREWCHRAYRGLGPTWEGFWHYFGDAFLQLTAERLDLFWQRRDVCQEHLTWKTHEGGVRPMHLLRANDTWKRDKELFDAISDPEWPGAALLGKAA